MYMVVEIKKICFMSYADLLQVNDHSFDLPEISQRSFAEPRPCVCVFVCVCVCKPLAPGALGNYPKKRKGNSRNPAHVHVCVCVCILSLRQAQALSSNIRLRLAIATLAVGSS